MSKVNGIATSENWRRAAKADRESRAEQLILPSGATILAARPEPLEWVMSGRIPQGLLAIALEDPESPRGGGDRELTREEILDLAAFAARLVEASVVEPRIGEGPDAIALEDIPIGDRAFIFEWACRALDGDDMGGSADDASNSIAHPAKEEPSSASLERFRQK
ncbi:MAG TPA: hypothetical protein VFZ27_01285 [Terriglobia bacterium]|nr:hypothetical protein [Terriglobia bacterium]